MSLREGDEVVFCHDVERFPHFTIPAGTPGFVSLARQGGDVMLVSVGGTLLGETGSSSGAQRTMGTARPCRGSSGG